MKQGRIVFTRFQSNEREMFNDIYAMDPDGGHEVRLTVNPEANGEYTDNASPRYNRDKTRIAFLSTRHHPHRLYNIFTMNLADGAVTQLTSGNLDFAGVDWAPDDSRFVVSCKDSSGLLQVHVMNPDGVGLTQLTKGPAENTSALWSPKGDLIAYTQFLPQQTVSHIWIMDDQGRHPIQLTTDAAAHSNPSWSPDGSWLVYRCDLGTPHLRRINVRSREVVRYQAPASGADSSPIWSDAGIVFSSNRDWEEAESLFNLYRMSDTGENVERLTTGQAFEYCGDW